MNDLALKFAWVLPITCWVLGQHVMATAAVMAQTTPGVAVFVWLGGAIGTAVSPFVAIVVLALYGLRFLEYRAEKSREVGGL